MRKMVMLPGSQVYHEYDCWHLRRSSKDRWRYITIDRANKRGFRPCKCCGTVRFHMRYEQKVLNRFIKGKNMEYRVIDDVMYVKTEISCWKIIYNPEAMTYALYHRNSKALPVDFTHPQNEHYHRQADKGCTAKMEELFRYIRSHDAFRKSEQETGGDLKRMSVSPKYRQQYINRKRRQEHRRLDELFAALERKHPEYTALAFC